MATAFVPGATANNGNGAGRGRGLADAVPPLRPTPAAGAGGLRDRLAALYEPIADDLGKAEEILREELGSRVDFVNDLVRRVQLYRGKRLRPALLLLVGAATGGVRENHRILAAVVEMIHAATLVHDDILDDATCRRHVPTVNSEWGNQASVLLGDYLFTHSFHLAASTGSAEACRLIGKATNLVCEGELHQVARRGNFELAEDEYIDIVAGKTAELVACACRLGARSSGVPAALEHSMAAFGRQLGVAFQIADDLLDLAGDAKTTGKDVGSDLREQKMTLPLIRFRDTAPPDAVARLRTLWESPEMPGQAADALALLAGSDAFAYAQARAEHYANAAARQLDALADSPAKRSLQAMAALAVHRSA